VLDFHGDIKSQRRWKICVMSYAMLEVANKDSRGKLESAGHGACFMDGFARS